MLQNASGLVLSLSELS